MLRLILVTCAIAASDCAKILSVFPTPSISHQLVFRPFTQELARRGHEVVVITPDPAFPKGQAPENLKEIDVHDISYKMWREHFVSKITGKSDLVSQLEVALDLFRSIFMAQLENHEVQEVIRHNNTFDLLFVEACVRPALLFSHFIKVPTIQISSLTGFIGNFETVGAPNHPLMYPLSLNQRVYDLTLWEKLTELYQDYVMNVMYKRLEKLEDGVFRAKFGPDVPSLKELKNNVEMLFLNVHPIWDGNRPVPPSVVYMGGIHQKDAKDLPRDLESYLNSSKHGVIYVSFGTNVNSSLIPPHKIQAMINVFTQLPYDVLWKWDQDKLPGKTNNIRISKWLPQSDLLRHPKIKLFITQAGLQSTDEAILAGVPLLGIPMLGDQWFNAEKYVQLKMGKKLLMEAMTSENLKEAVETIINDESYRRNVVKFRSLMHDQQTKPLDRVIWWTEHVLRHGGAGHLRSPAANISWGEYLQLDVVAVLLGMAAAVIILAYIGVYFAYMLLVTSYFSGEKIKQK